MKETSTCVSSFRFSSSALWCAAWGGSRENDHKMIIEELTTRGRWSQHDLSIDNLNTITTITPPWPRLSCCPWVRQSLRRKEHAASSMSPRTPISPAPNNHKDDYMRWPCLTTSHLSVLNRVDGLLKSPNVNPQLVNDGAKALDVLCVLRHLFLQSRAVTVPDDRPHF